eukprot:1150913-Pelagomonas_calceolata.AAC.2
MLALRAEHHAYGAADSDAHASWLWHSWQGHQGEQPPVPRFCIRTHSRSSAAFRKCLLVHKSPIFNPLGAQVLANYFSLKKGPNYSGMAVHYDVHIVSKQDADKPRGACAQPALTPPQPSISLALWTGLAQFLLASHSIPIQRASSFPSCTLIH